MAQYLISIVTSMFAAIYRSYMNDTTPAQSHVGIKGWLTMRSETEHNAVNALVGKQKHWKHTRWRTHAIGKLKVKSANNPRRSILEQWLMPSENMMS